MALSREVLGDLAGREVLLIGAGKMSELAAHYLIKAGASHVKVMNRTPSRGSELANKLGATAVPFEEQASAPQESRYRRQLHIFAHSNSQPSGSRRDCARTEAQADGDH